MTLNTPLFGCVIPHILTTASRLCFLAPLSLRLLNSSQSSYSDFKLDGVAMAPKLREVGDKSTVEYRCFFTDDNDDVISPWHSIPHKCGESGLYNMVVEIPRHSTAKMEIATTMENNPIKQDVMKDGSLRFLDCPYYWNYGAIPQTWEAPVSHGSGDSAFAGLSLIGDNDPVDAVDVSQTTVPSGSVVQVKVVGALALVDEGEIDWKMFVVRKEDPNFDKINDLCDVDQYYPGTTTGVQEFFRWYKTPKGKPVNGFLPGKNFVGRDEAVRILESMHESYLKLLSGEHECADLWLPKA